MTLTVKVSAVNLEDVNKGVLKDGYEVKYGDTFLLGESSIPVVYGTVINKESDDEWHFLASLETGRARFRSDLVDRDVTLMNNSARTLFEEAEKHFNLRYVNVNLYLHTVENGYSDTVDKVSTTPFFVVEHMSPLEGTVVIPYLIVDASTEKGGLGEYKAMRGVDAIHAMPLTEDGKKVKSTSTKQEMRHTEAFTAKHSKGDKVLGVSRSTVSVRSN